MDLGPHAGFIVIAYAAAIVIVVGLIVWIILDRRHLARAVGELEAKGITRRSERARGDAAGANPG
jgi:heme exporter protein D